MPDYNELLFSKQNYLFVTAHPDDVDVFFAGLIAKLAAQNKNIYVVVVTNGARGSRENEVSEETLAKMRIQEQIEALSKLGVKAENIFNLNYKDGEVENSYKFIGEIAYYIRKSKADIVATHDPNLYLQTNSKTGFFIQHRDHRNTATSVIDAVYPFSRDRSFFTQHAVEGIEPHSCFNILLADAPDNNLTLDITDVVGQKREAMQAHKSQFDEETIDEIINAFKDENGKEVEFFKFLNLLW